MSHERHKKVIEEYIVSRKGQATQNDIVRHMEQKQLLSRLPTRALIKDLEKAGGIRIIRAERHGQSYRYSIDDESEFNKINEDLRRLEKRIDKLQILKAKKPLNDSEKEAITYVPDEEVIIWDLLLRLVQCKLFPLEDSELLERKIIKLLLALTVKKIAAMKAIRAQKRLISESKN